MRKFNFDPAPKANRTHTNRNSQSEIITFCGHKQLVIGRKSNIFLSSNVLKMSWKRSCRPSIQHPTFLDGHNIKVASIGRTFAIHRHSQLPFRFTPTSWTYQSLFYYHRPHITKLKIEQKQKNWVTIHTLPHLKCTGLVSGRSSHLPFKMN